MGRSESIVFLIIIALSLPLLIVTAHTADAQGITIDPTSGLITPEGGTDSFTVVIDSQPQGANQVVLYLFSSSGQGDVSPTLMTFTAFDWDTPQTATVTGIDDYADDGDVMYSIWISVDDANTTEDSYDPLPDQSVSVTSIDDDTAGITIDPTSGLITPEAGGTASFTVVIDTETQGSNVVWLHLSPSSGQGVVSPSNMTFNTFNWNVPQTATVTAIDDYADDGDVMYSIWISVNDASTTEGSYDSLPDQSVSVTSIDDDTAGITVNPSSGLITTEAGGADSFTVVIDSETQGSNVVVLELNCSDPGEGDVSPTVMTFNTFNWDTPQPATVTGIDDGEIDGDVGYSITVAVNDASTTEDVYDALPDEPVSVTNIDDEPSTSVTQYIDSVGFYLFGEAVNVGLNVTDLTQAGTVTITVHPDQFHPGAENDSVKRWFEITNTGFVGTFDLSLSYEDTELGSEVETNLCLWRYDGGTWYPHIGDVETGDNIVTVYGVTDFSDWVIRDNQIQPPVPEVVTIVMISLGVLILGGFIWYRRLQILSGITSLL